LSDSLLGVAVAFAPKDFIANFPEIVKALSFSSESLYSLFLELVIQKKYFDITTLYKSFELVKDTIFECKNDEILADSYKLITTADQIVDGLGIEARKSANYDDKTIYDFRRLYESVFKKGLTIHGRLRETWSYIIGLSPNKAAGIINRHYLGDDGFYVLVRKRILRHLSSLSDLVDELLADSHPYFKGQFSADIELMHRKIMKIVHLSESGKIEHAVFEKEWENETIKQVRTRINSYVVDAGSPLRKFLNSQFCNAYEEVFQRIDYWKDKFNSNGIELNWEDSAKDCEVFLNQDSFLSIINNLLENVLKYGFGDNYEGSPKSIVSTNIDDKFYVIKICDNGVGLSFDDKEKLHNRTQEILRFFNGVVSIHSKTYETCLILKLYTREAVLRQ